MNTSQANKLVHEMIKLIDECRAKLAKHRGDSSVLGNIDKYSQIEKNLEKAENLIRSLTGFN